MNITRSLSVLSRKNLNRYSIRQISISSSKNQKPQVTQPQVQEEKYDFEDLRVYERTERRKAAIEPFMKNVFLSKFNRELLAYPEFISKDEYENLESRVQRLSKVFNDKEKDEKDRHNVLKQSRLFAAPVSLTNNGLAANITERLRFLEAISSDIRLAKRLSDHWVCLDALKYGLAEQDYQNLVTDLSSGDNILSLCIKEPISLRISQPDFRTTAQLDGHGIWRINGEKECNETSGFKVVLCMIEANRLRAFLVHPNTEGVVEKTGRITFMDSPGTPLNEISESDLATLLGNSRLQTAILCNMALKQATEVTIKYIKERYVSGRPLSEVSTIRQKIGDSMLTLYGTESACYFTAGLVDMYESPDADMEKAMCRNYIAEHGITAMSRLTSIGGLHFNEEYRRCVDDFHHLLWDETNENVNMFIALNGIQHAGKMLSNEIRQIRNPLMHPSFIFKKVFADRLQESDTPKLTLRLAEHLHPSLSQPSEQLEYSVLRMRFACETIMGRYGVEVASAFTELERLAQAATEILAMTSVLGRASRSYCIGLRNSEEDMKLGACFVDRSKPRLQQLILDLTNGEYLNLDHFKVSFGRKVMDTSSFLVEKPIDRSFW